MKLSILLLLLLLLLLFVAETIQFSIANDDEEEGFLMEHRLFWHAMMRSVRSMSTSVLREEIVASSVAAYKASEKYPQGEEHGGRRSDNLLLNVEELATRDAEGKTSIDKTPPPPQEDHHFSQEVSTSFGIRQHKKLRASADGKYRKVIDTITDPDVLASAHECLKSNRLKIGRSSISLLDSQESSGIVDWRWFEQTAAELRSGVYEFRPARKISIPKLGEPGETRAFTLINSKDQIIQEATRAALESIFQPSTFSQHHVFASRQAALRSLKQDWKGLSWFLEFDFEKRFDTAHQKRLKNILAEKIQDQCFLDLITKMFNAGTINIGRRSSTGAEEVGILAPILCDIFFQKLDHEVEQIKKEWDTAPTMRSINPAYRKLMFLDKRTMSRLGRNAEALRREKRHRVRIARKLGITPYNYKDPEYLKVRYVRFADNFLMGVAGPKSMALKIMKQITTFLKSNLSLQVNMDTTKPRHAISEKVLFMGVFVKILDPKDATSMSIGHVQASSKKKKSQVLRLKQRLEDRWLQESRQAMLKCWTVAYEKWRRELGKDGAKRRAIETALQQLLMMIPPQEDSLQRQKSTQVTLQVFMSAAMQQGLFPKEEVHIFNQVLDALQKSHEQVDQEIFEESED